MPQSLNQFVNQIICGDARQVLQQFPDESIDCVITSPPYWALRDYGVNDQLGLEASFQQYIERLCDIFDEVRRVLKKSGTCWIVLGDTYSTRNTSKGKWSTCLQSKAYDRETTLPAFKRPVTDMPGKCLLLIPSRIAIEMISRGWILRNELIWWKPNCMPASIKDRFTVDFEKIFFFVKSRRYFFEQQFEDLRDRERASRRLVNPAGNQKRKPGDDYISAINPKTAEASRLRILANGRNKRCVWRVATRPFSENHFAVYPPELIETPIKAGCPKGGIVLDPFMGSGTTALVAQRLGKKFIGIDLNPEYIKMAKARLAKQPLPLVF
jgi:site-specific DNA-methyltransferase (adenine-specific)